MEFLRTLAFGGAAAGNGLTLQQAVLSLVLAFVFGQLAAWVYVYTHWGLSYSRSFVHSIILLTVITAFGMMVIGGNIVVAFGLIGALAIIRFRNILKDTRDTAFVFFSLVVGLATGTGRHGLALLGTTFFCLVLLYLHWSFFGSRFISDGFVRLRFDLEKTGRSALSGILDRYCRTTHLISQRFQDTGSGELAYQLTMRDPARADEMVEELKRLDGILNVTFVLQEEQAEV